MQNGRADIITTLRVDGDEIDSKLTAPAQEAQNALENMSNEARDASPALALLSESAGGFGDGLRDIPILGSAIQKLGPVGIAASVGISAGVTAVRGLISISEMARDAVREISTEADNLGVSTTGFQALRREAAGANIDFNTLQSSLTDFQSKIGQLDQGQGELATRLAPATAQTISDAANFEEKISAISAALREAGSETEFINIATAAFGDTGVETGRFLRDNVTSLQDLQDEYQGLGGIITDTQVRAIEANAQVIDGLKATSAGLSNQAAANVESFGSAIEIFFRKNIVEIQRSFVNLTGPGANSPRRGLQALESDIETVGARLVELRQTLEDSGPEGNFLTELEIEGTQAKLDKLLETLEKVKNQPSAPFSGPVDPINGVPGDFVVNTQPDIDPEAIDLVNRLKEQSLTLDEKRIRALADYEAALAGGVSVTREEDAAIRANIASRFEDTASIRENEQAQRKSIRGLEEKNRLKQQAATIQAQLGDVTAAVSARREELNQIAAQTGLTQDQVNLSVSEYERRLTGADRAQRSLKNALRQTLDIHEIYTADIEKLTDLQAKANIPPAQFNEILAQRNQLYAEQQQRQADAQEREDFGGETLAEAGARIKASLQTATQVIDAKIEAEQRILDALVGEGVLSSDQALARLMSYRDELENVADNTDKLSDAQNGLNDVINNATRGMSEFERLGVQALTSLVLNTRNAKGELTGLGGIIDDLFKSFGGGSDSDGDSDGGGGFLSSIFGGFGSGSDSDSDGNGGGIFASIFHSGSSSVGRGSAPTRQVSAALFDNAPRFHRGTSNVGSDEVAAILQRGERVSTESETRDMVAAINAATASSINNSDSGLRLVINNHGAPVSAVQDEGTDAQGQRQMILTINRLVDERVPQALGSRASENVMRQTYGLHRQIGGQR